MATPMNFRKEIEKTIPFYVDKETQAQYIEAWGRSIAERVAEKVEEETIRRVQDEMKAHSQYFPRHYTIPPKADT